MSFFSPLISRILGKRKEGPEESESSSGEETEDEEEVHPMDDVLEELTPEQEEVEDDDDETPFEDPDDAPGAVFDPSTATLSQLLTRIIPDANIHCPNVIIVGAQSSGKTKMVISMVFHHLIDNKSVTDEMGEKLLKIFRTGEKMVTRRPTKIQFVKTDAGSPCNIKLSLGAQSAQYAEPLFDQIIDSVHEESKTRDGRAFVGELVVTILAPDLPSMTFTDLPGLITEDREIADEEDMSIRKMVKKYMRKLNTTLVVVEPASTEDFETSQVAPLLKEMQNSDRPHIFNKSVLVLSKCDKIRQGMEGRIMSLMDLTSPSIADYPFKHVVGVVNKIESVARTPVQVDEGRQSFAEFKAQFRATKQHEKEIFASYKNLDNSPCCMKTQCTTASVFHQMDRITFDQVHNSIGRGLDSIHTKVDELGQRMRGELAPPLSYYDTVRTNAAGVSEVDKSNRGAILRSLRDSLKKLLATHFKELKFYDRPVHDVQRLLAVQVEFLERIGVKWPEEHSYGDMFLSQRQSEAIDATRKFFGRFITRKIKESVMQVLQDQDVGCFAGIHSRFHRIDRFERLVFALTTEMLKLLPSCLQNAKDAVNSYLVQFYDFEVPKGVTRERFGRLFDELHHVSIRRAFESLRAASKGTELDALFYNDALFEEHAEFVSLRDELHTRWENLRQQKWILTRCKQVTSNEELRDTLQEAYEDQRTRQGSPQSNSDHWQDFWQRAEDLDRVQGSRRVRAPPTSMFSRTSSSASASNLTATVPVISSAQTSQQRDEMEGISQLENWPEDSQESSAGQPSQQQFPPSRHSQKHSQRQDEPQSQQEQEESQQSVVLDTRMEVGAGNAVANGESQRSHVQESAQAEHEPEAVSSSLPVDRDNRSHTMPFKRFKASHHDDEVTSPLAVPISSSTHTTHVTHDAFPMPVSAQASGYIAFSDLNRADYNNHQQHQEQQDAFSPAKSTFVSGSLFSGRNEPVSSPAAALRSPAVPAPTLMNQARTFFDSMLGSPGHSSSVATPNATNAAAGGAGHSTSAGRVLNTAASNRTNNAASTTTPGQLYRPNYTSSSTTSNYTNNNTNAQNATGAHHSASTPATTASSNANYSSVKREYNYNNQSRHEDGSREAKGSPDDLIDLTD